MEKAPVIALFPEAGYGPGLNCVAIAQELRRLGAVPVFLCHPGFTRVFEEYGFKEYHLPASARVNAKAMENYWQNFIETNKRHFNLSAEAQLPAYVGPTWDAIVNTVEAVDDGLADVLTRIRPDAIVLDNTIMFPAVANAGCPWVRVTSCAETEIPDPRVPPFLSGLNEADEAACSAFKKSYLKNTRKAHQRYNSYRKSRGLSVLENGTFMEPSETLNLLLSPQAVRYEREVKLPEGKYVYLEGCVRMESQFDLPDFSIDFDPIVYMSFGSLGAIDTKLIGRMIAVFARLPARFVVNVGDFLDAYDGVPDNVYLGSWFPQPSLVAKSDLFIHHGGNNSFCEALYFGVPSLVMPYCWDGHDNAQRAQATGVGLRMNRGDWQAEALERAIMSLLNDRSMKDRLQGISQYMQANPGATRAASEILRAVGWKHPS